MSPIMTVVFVVLLAIPALLLLVSVIACVVAAFKADSNESRFVAIQDRENLYYDPETGIVYVISGQLPTTEVADM